MLTFEGSSWFRQRIILSTLSGKPIIIKRLHENEESGGLQEYEVSFIRLIDSLTNGSQIVVDEEGSTLKFNPGLLLGGKLEHKCSLKRAIGYYLEALFCLAPFCKKPLHITLTGITNNRDDPTVDAIKLSSLPVLKRFILNDEELELKITKRGMAPDGGGEVLFRCPVVNYFRPIKLLEPGKIKRIRGVAYTVRVSPAFSNRMVDTAKGLLLKFLPDVYIYTDHYKGKNSGNSPGFGLTLVAESTKGVFLVAEAASHPSGTEGKENLPEDIAQEAVSNLFEEIFRGGCVDSVNQSLMFLFMALGMPDISKIKTGPLSPYSIEFLRNMQAFLEVKMKLETESSEDLNLGSHKVIATCLGIGFSNISKVTT